MSEPSAFVLELQRLHQAQLDAETAEDREQADHDVAHLMRLHTQGRDREWFDARAAAARNDA